MLHWRFKKFSILPEIKVIGDCSVEYEPFLILASLLFLKIAENFGGMAYRPDQFPETDNEFSLSFNIVFKRKDDVERYIEYINDNYSYNYDEYGYGYDM